MGLIELSLWDKLRRLKADKDLDAVSGNLPIFDENGNLVDSGTDPSDYEPSDATILKKADVVDSLESEVTDVPLSANQGRVLKDAQDVLNGDVTTEGSVAKAIDDAVSPLAEVVDTNRLYSDSQYIELKAKADSLQVKCNTLQAEVYTDDPILQYGATEIIGKGYEADGTPIDVSANVVDGKLSMEQKGLAITNLVKNGDFAIDTNADGIPNNWLVIGATCSIANKIASITGTAGISTQFYQLNIATVKEGDVFYFPFRARVRNANATSMNLNLEFGTGAVVIAKSITTPTQDLWYDMSVRRVIPAGRSGAMLINIRTSYADATGNVTEVDGNYGVSAYNLTALGLDHITDTAILSKLLPYVDGTKNVGKMGMQILDADDNVTQTIFLPAIGNSLPNGVADSIKTVSDGWEHTKRVQEYTLQSTDINELLNWESIQAVRIPKAKIVGATAWVDGIEGKVSVVGFSEVTATGLFASTTPYVFATTSTLLALTFPTSTYATLAEAKTALAGTVIYYQLATPITTHYDLPLPTSGKTIHRFAGEEKIALYGTGLTFSENVLSVLSAVKFVAGVMTDITSLATITTNTVTFSGVNATDVVYVKVEHDVDRPLGVLEHTPAVSNTASRLASLEARVSALEV